eukprot:TRINITY_DN3704_c0_g1_i1.p1 TRINITY_DN3704_c0_g1~~TRINITY_DN3704_c0_g1_i1.p1  ORF type:complete len:240 (-),score=53.05 TRINITY_DN3704_c0_g1_i1:254-913(-)
MCIRDRQGTVRATNAVVYGGGQSSTAANAGFEAQRPAAPAQSQSQPVIGKKLFSFIDKLIGAGEEGAAPAQNVNARPPQAATAPSNPAPAQKSSSSVQPKKEPQFYYDKELKRWVIDGKPVEDDEDEKKKKEEEERLKNEPLPPPPIIGPPKGVPGAPAPAPTPGLVAKTGPMGNPFGGGADGAHAQTASGKRVLQNRYVAQKMQTSCCHWLFRLCVYY